ncbi:MAG TPA: LysM peptidoglycan-binding domain-containing protein [Anaerolineae bacterium]
MAERTYTVESGDSLSLIAKKVWGDMSRWKEIFEANKDKISDPNVIQVGWVLVIPGEQQGEAKVSQDDRAEQARASEEGATGATGESEDRDDRARASDSGESVEEADRPVRARGRDNE